MNLITTVVLNTKNITNSVKYIMDNIQTLDVYVNLINDNIYSKEGCNVFIVLDNDKLCTIEEDGTSLKKGGDITEYFINDECIQYDASICKIEAFEYDEEVYPPIRACVGGTNYHAFISK